MNAQLAMIILIEEIQPTPCTLHITPAISGIKIFCTYQQRY